MKNGRFIRQGILAVLFGISAWWCAGRFDRDYWGWPLTLLFGAGFTGITVYLVRSMAGKPAPFQLVLKMADENGGDDEDDQTFKLLHDRFKRLFPKSGAIRFEGFDTDGSFIWFYFKGLDEVAVQRQVLSQLQGCRVRKGSYYLSKATQPTAPPNDGSVTPLGGSEVREGPSSAG